MTRCSRTPLLLFVLLVWSLLTAMLGTLLTALIYIPWFDGNDGPASSMLELLSMWWDSPAYWIHIAVIVPLLVGTQVLFLLPVAPVELRVGTVRSLRGSIVIAGLVAATLTVSLCMALAALVQLIFGGIDAFGFILFSGLDGVAFIHPQLYLQWGGLIPLACLLVSWLLWSLAIGVFVRRGQPTTRMSRLTGILFAGSLLEVVLILPLEAMVRRRADCYCTTGSFQGLVGGCVAALWLLGPMACMLLFKRRSSWWARHCRRCGYDKTAAAGDRCPECGWAWVVEEPKHDS